MANCTKCGAEIPAERLEVLPNTTTCVDCSDVGQMVGFMTPTASKGCAPVLQMVQSNDREALRRAYRAHRRSR